MIIRHLKTNYGSLIGSKTMRSLSLLFSANILNGAIGFATSVMMLRYVDKEIIAVIYPLVSILMIVSQFGDLGLSNSFIKIASFHYISDKYKSLQFFNAAYKLKIFLSIGIMILSIPAASLIASWTFGAPIYVNWVRLILLVTGLQIMSSYASSALQIEGKFLPLSITRVIPSLLKMLLIGVCIWFKAANLAWIFWAFSLVPISTFILTFFYTNKDPLYKIHSTPTQLSELLHVSKWIALSVLAYSVTGQLDVLMTRAIAGTDELNKLLGGQKLASVFPLLTASLFTVLLPKVSSMKSKKELNFFLRKSARIIFPTTILLFAILPLSHFFIPFILGVKYNSSVEVFNILMIGHIVGMTVIPLSLILYNLNKEPVLLLMYVVQLLFNMIGNYIFVRTNGAVGASWVTTLSNLIPIIIIYSELKKEGILKYTEEIA